MGCACFEDIVCTGAESLLLILLLLLRLLPASSPARSPAFSPTLSIAKICDTKWPDTHTQSAAKCGLGHLPCSQTFSGAAICYLWRGHRRLNTPWSPWSGSMDPTRASLNEDIICIVLEDC